MQRDLYRKLGVQRLKRCCVGRVIDGIGPDLLRNRRIEHGRVIRSVDRAESWRQSADTLIAVYLKIEDLYRQRVAGLRSVDVERSGKRVIAWGHAESVAGFLHRVAETV